MSGTDLYPFDTLRRSVESMAREAAAQLLARAAQATANEARKFRDSVLDDTQACEMSSSPLKMSLSKMLSTYQQHIKNQGTHHNIDSRAIAGAIAWEYEENKLGRRTDFLQSITQRMGGLRLNENGLLARRVRENVPVVGPWASQVASGGLLFGEGLGWGSMHAEVARKLRPSASLSQLQYLRMEAEHAVALVAEEMGRLADRYFDLTGQGIWVRDMPTVLALFYHAGEDTVKKSASRRETESRDKSGYLTLHVSPDDMARWVGHHIARFSQFKTIPVPPQRAGIIRIKTDMGC